MKRSTKRLFALVLAAALLCAALYLPVGAAPAAAGENGAVCPLVIARGMDFNRLYTNYGTPAQQPLFHGVTAAGVLKTLTAAVKNAGREGFNHALAMAAVDYAREILGDMACDRAGNSVKDVGFAKYNCSVADSPALQTLLKESASQEEALVRSAAETLGAENVYFFTYDYRMDPYVLAEELRDLIDLARTDHGTDKVDLINCSMAGVITDCYLARYGGGALRKCVFLSSTFCGTNVATEVLRGDVQTDGAFLQRYIAQMTGNPLLGRILRATGLLDLAARWFNGFVASEKDYIYAEFLRDAFGTMLSFWANVQPDAVDDCIGMIFPDAALQAEYAPLIEKIRRLQGIMENRNELLLSLPAQGVDVAVIAGYNSAPIPLYPSAAEQTDAILDSRWMLGCADVSPLDGKLPAAGERVSPDGCVDLTDALFPADTWAIKNAGHVPTTHGSDCTALVLSVLQYEGDANVRSFERFPQFFTVDAKTKNIVSDRSPVC